MKQASQGFRRLTVPVPIHQLQYELTGNIKRLRAQFHDHKIFHRLGNYLYTCSYTSEDGASHHLFDVCEELLAGLNYNPHPGLQKGVLFLTR